MRIVTIVATLLLLLGALSCGSRSSLDSARPSGPAPAGVQPELYQRLLDELARLGKDPSAINAAGPGSGNQVFDLDGAVIDPDGAGPGTPTGITLRWTDRLIGDFDNNGSVSISDLTPLGSNLGQSPAYRDPVSVNGIDWWPVGDQADAGGAAPDKPAAPGSGARNWLLARVDGDANGLVNISDLTPLAAHIGERIDGYRVYRRGPGETGFTLLANPADPSAPLTLSRIALSGGVFNRPLVYSFDDFFGIDGVYEYRVAPYCIDVDQEGPASLSFWIDSRTGQPVNTGLRAILIADVTAGLQPLAVNFDATFSSGSIVRYEWDFNGDGAFERNTGDVGKTDYIYLSNAAYDAVVRVTDNVGNMAEDSLRIQVNAPGGNQPPSAALSAAPLTGTVPLTVQFDAGGSIDPDGQILTHEWDFDGDGVYDMNTGTVAKASNVYTQGGSYEARVRIIDNAGGTASAKVTIAALSPGGNQPPLAALTADHPNGAAPLTVQFNGAGSTDPDGQILIHEWDFDGDGVYDLNSGTIASAGYTYTSAGVFTARLRVTDNGGSMAIATLQVDSTGTAPDNQPPAVSLQGTPTSGQISYQLSSGTPPNATYQNDGLSVSFTASASDGDGTIATYEWDFEGDGIFDFTSADIPSATHVYKQAGTYQARVRAIDNENGFGLSQAVPITVQNTAPLLQASYSPQPLDGQAAVESPLTVRLKADQSVDLDGAIVKYEWDLDNNGSYELDSGTQPYIDKVFDTASTQTFTFGVRLTDSGNATSTGTIQVPLKDDYDEVEQNDSVAQATLFALSGTTQLTVDGNLGGAANKGYDSDDTDWFRFTLPGPRAVTAVLNPNPSGSDVNLDLRVYAGDGTTLLASSLNTSGEDRVDDLVFLAGGTFFVKVNRFSSNGEDSFDYQLAVTPGNIDWKEAEAQTVGDATKNNDTLATAQQIQAGDFGANDHLLDFYGRFSKDPGDVNNDAAPNNADWYTWNVNSGVDISITLTFRHSDADLDLYLVNGSDQVIASSTSSTDNEAITLTTGQPGWTTGNWYVKVVRQTAGRDCAYQLDVVGGGTATLYELKGNAFEELLLSENVSDGWQVVVDDLATLNEDRDYVGVVDSSLGQHNWVVEIPNGTYELTLENESGTVQNSFKLMIGGDLNSPIQELLPAQIKMLNGTVTFQGDDAANSSRVGSQLAQPLTIYETTG